MRNASFRISLMLVYLLSNIVTALLTTTTNNNNLPVLRLDDRAVHIAVGLRLGANICEPHECPCGATVDAKGLHGLSCKGGSGR